MVKPLPRDEQENGLPWRGGPEDAELGEEPAPGPLQGRRSFLAGAGLGWAIFGAGSLAGSLAVLRFLFPDDPADQEVRFKVGRPQDYAPGHADERWKLLRGIWVVRDEEMLYVLSTTCTHLGCTIRWLPGEGMFQCPCHGSGFDLRGINIEGPAPRPLERFKVRLGPDGQIEVDLSRKYQEELGQWSDPDSFLKVGSR